MTRRIKRIDRWRGCRVQRMLSVGLLAVCGGWCIESSRLAAQESGTAESQPAAAAADDAQMQERYEKFEKMLSGAKLIGSFTIVGREGGGLNDEEYFISRVTKSTEGDYWVFNARIKYGDKDYTVPLPLEVKWAGDTPVVTLTDLTILGQGPFSARVVFHDGKYAGTWSHGEVGGHLFGRIESRPEMTEPKER